MMSGLAVVATATQGHDSILVDASEVGLTYEPGDFQDLARKINFLARDPGRLLSYRRKAFQLARTRLNWEREQNIILDLVAKLEEKSFRHLKSSQLLRPKQMLVGK